MNRVLAQIQAVGIVPVVKLDDAAHAVPLARALCTGGLGAAEVTFRTAAAAESIARMTAEVPEILVGAGTVLTERQVDEAVAAGAKFIVSPGTSSAVVRRCMEKGVPIVPGVVTPTEIEAALALGLDVLKFFPAEPSGGLAMIKALTAPYTGIRFMPTGGISAANVAEYLAYDKIMACGGSWMVKDSLIQAGDFNSITAMTQEAADIVKAVRGGN